MSKRTTKATHGVCCPKGHTEGLQVRRIFDCPVALVRPDELDFDDTRRVDFEPVDYDVRSNEPGVDSGVWCPTCEEWFNEDECVHPLDDAGNPMIADLGGEDE